MTKTIKHTFFYAHKPEAVWDYLTKPELIAQWLMPNNFKPEVGHDFKFTIKPMPAFNFDGIIYCKVLELIPGKRLVYSWKGGPEPGKLTLDSIVEWTLVAKNNGTELLLEHKGFATDEAMLQIFTVMDAGWAQNIAKIDTFLKAATV
jgi:uncharacterized protein YndB with AHSA1/START domain